MLGTQGPERDRLVGVDHPTETEEEQRDKLQAWIQFLNRNEPSENKRESGRRAWERWAEI